MNNLQREYEDLYLNQAGSGLGSVYRGDQYQRGHGFFNSIFQNILKPLGLYLGKQALNTGVDIGSDILSGKNIKESAKKNVGKVGRNILDDSLKRVKKFAQTGTGVKKRKRRTKTKKPTRNTSSLSKNKNKMTKKKASVTKKKPKKKGRKKTTRKSKFDHLFR